LVGDSAAFGVKQQGSAGENAEAAYVFDLPDVTSNQGPDACERDFTYGADGNMTGDEDFTYHWDGENRLVRVEPLAAALGDHRVRYTYDYQGRRVKRLLDEWQTVGPVTTWVTVEDTRYVYDGWNVVLELDGLSSNAMQKQYTWGLDLSQTLQGAGGVGGLLACRDLAGSGTSRRTPLGILKCKSLGPRGVQATKCRHTCHAMATSPFDGLQ